MTVANYPHPIMDATAREEGGFADMKGDPGGATMNGITQATYDIYRKKKGLSLDSVRRIAPDEKADIYRSEYWNAIAGDRLASGPDMSCFDEAVNSGPRQAMTAFRQCGDPNFDTINFIHRFADRRLAYMHAIRHGSLWARFGKDWGARVGRIEAQSLQLATARRTSQPQVLANAHARAAAKAKTAKRRSGAIAGAGTAAGGAGTVSAQPARPEEAAAPVGLYIGGGLLLAAVLVGALIYSNIHGARASGIAQITGA